MHAMTIRSTACHSFSNGSINQVSNGISPVQGLEKTGRLDGHSLSGCANLWLSCVAIEAYRCWQANSKDLQQPSHLIGAELSAADGARSNVSRCFTASRVPYAASAMHLGASPIQVRDLNSHKNASFFLRLLIPHQPHKHV